MTSRRSASFDPAERPGPAAAQKIQAITDRLAARAGRVDFVGAEEFKHPLIEARRLERTLQLARVAGALLVLSLGPLFRTTDPMHLVFLAGGLAIWAAVLQLLLQRARSTEDQRRLEFVGLAIDMVVVVYAMWIFSADPDWSIWTIGVLVIIGTAFRFGRIGAIGSAIVLAIAYLAISAYRTATYGFSTTAPLAAFHIIMYLLTALLLSGALRELYRLRAQHIDIDALKRAQRVSEAAQAEAESMLETVREPVVILDANLRVVQANRSFYERFQVTAVVTEGQLIYDLGNRQWDIPQLRALLENVIPQDSVVRDFEVEDDFERIGRRSMCLNAARVATEAGERVLILLAIEDVTDAKHLEEARAALAEREQALRGAAEAATEAKDRFLAVVSHELRTPLQAMLSWIRLLRSRQLGAAQTERALAVIERNTVLQARLIEDLLDVSRISVGMLQLVSAPIAVGPAVEAAADGLRPAADAKGIRFLVSIEEEVGSIQGDAVRLGQMVVNLLSNAIKFTPSGGRIELRVARRGSEVEIIVRDTGAGISPDELSQIIAPFGTGPRTRSQGGLGLGLGITRHLAELHGGALHAASAGPGQGATFTLTLPLTAERPVVDRPADQGDAPLAPPDLAGLRVLVVEDDTDTREVITVMLEESGALVTTVETVEAALGALETATPDVLMSDLSMPERDGYDLIRSVRALDPARGGRVPAIALTAYARSEDRERVISAGYQRYLSKPIDLEELVAAIATLADRT